MSRGNLSQDAQRGLSRRHAGGVRRWFAYNIGRHALKPLPRKGLDWFELTIVAAIAAVLSIIVAVLIGSCGKALEPQASAPVWKCLKAPHISIAFDSYDSQGYSYFRLVSRNESTECQALAIDLIAMLKDGHWEQTEIGDPLFIPPPPHWDTGISDRLDMGGTIRINGSTAIRMRTQTPLPTDNQITVEKGQEK